jgi:hypothetical protein
MSGDWRRLHRVRGASSGSPENHWVPWLIHKAKTEEPKTEVQRHRTGLTGVRRRSSETLKRRTHVGVDGRLSYQSSYGFASRQISSRSQGTLLPSSGEPKVSNPWNNLQCKDSV